MGILQAAYRTYENFADLAGVWDADKSEPLIPVSHRISKASIEIAISVDGVFQSVKLLKGEKTIIPVTVDSAGRTNRKIAAHPLCEKLQYLIPDYEKKYENYVQTLRRWAESPFSHPILKAVLQYIQQGSLVADLVVAGIIQLDHSGKLKEADSNNLVRWDILGCPQGDGRCWCNQELFQCFASFYESQLKGQDQDLCMVTGKPDVVCNSHPKGVLAFSNGAKLVSANDSSGFTSRGRFCLETEAANVGYFASQKVHSALRYVAANFGILVGDRKNKRMFLCWNPDGKQVPCLYDFGLPSCEVEEMIDYKRELRKTLYGIENQLRGIDDVVVASLEAATEGRLSITYYRELKASDYLERVERWYASCCYLSYRGIRSPDIQDIVRYAFGVLRKGKMEVDGQLLAQQFQRLVHCIVDAQAIPVSIVQALFHKAGNLQVYEQKNDDGRNHRAILVNTACAVIRKYRNDKQNEEVWKLTLNTEERNRSYLFGRLLAVAELAEQGTYDRGFKKKKDDDVKESESAQRAYGNDEFRVPNALRLQSAFSRRPWRIWHLIWDALNPYLARLPLQKRNYYQGWIDEIMEKLGPDELSDQDHPLEDVYLLGYSHQRTAILARNKKNDGGENGNECNEEEN